MLNAVSNQNIYHFFCLLFGSSFFKRRRGSGLTPMTLCIYRR